MIPRHEPDPTTPRLSPFDTLPLSTSTSSFSSPPHPSPPPLFCSCALPPCAPAEVLALREQGRDLSKEPVMMQDFEQAIKKINPSVSQEDIQKQEQWLREFGST